MKSVRFARFLAVLMAPAMLFGCHRPPPPAPRAHVRPTMTTVRVQKRTLVREPGQPGFIEAYEQTSIYPKISGFVGKWNVDIGDPIREGMVLAHLDVPDLVAQYEEKTADVDLAEERVKVARQMVAVAEENFRSAQSEIDQAKANVGKYKADVAYWTADYKRVHQLFLDKAVEQPVDEASFKHMQATIASQQAAEAGVLVAQSTAAARKADYDKAKVDVNAAIAQVKVAKAAEKRYAALVGYTDIKAPYDGIVVLRNVSRGDFVEPASGDQSAPRDNRGQSRTSSYPLYVVARTDKVRIFLDIPEMDANGVERGSNASISIPGLDNMELTGQVARTSWALSAKTRTLRAEIDVANTDKRILPNMYAYGKVEVKRANVWAVPLRAVTQIGNQNYCYQYENGKAVQVAVQTGINDGVWIEILKKRVGKEWRDFDGAEEILVGDLTQLADGEPVRLSTAKK